MDLKKLDLNIASIKSECAMLKDLIGDDSYLEYFINGYQGSLSRMYKNIKILEEVKNKLIEKEEKRGRSL